MGTPSAKVIMNCEKEPGINKPHTRASLPELARSGEIIARLHYKHFVPTKALCKFNQSTDSGHGDRKRLNDLLIRATCLHHQSSQSRNITKDVISGHHRHTGKPTSIWQL